MAKPFDLISKLRPRTEYQLSSSTKSAYCFAAVPHMSEICDFINHSAYTQQPQLW